MTLEHLRLLLCTNGREITQPSLEYGVWLAGLLKVPVLLLGIIEYPDQKKNVEKLLYETGQKLSEQDLAYETRIDSGRGSIVIAQHAHSGNYLTVVGPLGRPAWRRALQGRSFRRILEKVETPILYVPEVRLPLRRLLLCLGGLGYAEGVVHLGLYLAQPVGASITLLHVVEPITLNYPVAREIHDHWKDILETDTPQGKNLRSAMAEIQKTGVEVQFKVRHGSAVHEIIDEVHKGEYHLVGMGSPYSAHSLRHLYMPNVTAEVAETINCPVLTVRQGHDLVD